ncbi:MAG: thiamine phosphate synthase [Acidobacteriota bacterium]|nr:thiamine phosphate synthase [Acidobacteriota bacterium]
MLPEAKSAQNAAVTRPIVCYVTDRRALEGENPQAALTSSIRDAVVAGVDWIQIREKDLSSRDLLHVAASAVRAAAKHREAERTSVIVNDRLDVALAAGASGVHLGEESIPAAEVVRWCRSGNAPAGFLVGVSCHSLSDAQVAEAVGASYVIFGPVFDTPSKRPFGAPQGTQKLQELSSAVRVPVIAIGGIDEKTAADCLRAGAAGIAAIRLFQERRGAAELAKRVAALHALGARG